MDDSSVMFAMFTSDFRSKMRALASQVGVRFDTRGAWVGHVRLRQASASAFKVLLERMAVLRQESQASPEVIKASLAAWSLVHGEAMWVLGGFMSEMPEALKLQRSEMVRLLDPHGLDDGRLHMRT